MKLPFTLEQFLAVFKAYHDAVGPAPLILNLVALVIIYLAYRGSTRHGKTIALLLAFLWLWMGLVYHGLYFSRINKAAYLFGLLFSLQGLMFIYYGYMKQHLIFQLKKDIYGLTGMIFMVYALIIYPFLGNSLGHVYPAAPTFGLPCPTTIFTFGVLLWVPEKLPVAIWVIPFVWSVIGFSAAFSLGMKEDLGLIVAGLISGILMIVHNRRLGQA